MRDLVAALIGTNLIAGVVNYARTVVGTIWPTMLVISAERVSTPRLLARIGAGIGLATAGLGVLFMAMVVGFGNLFTGVPWVTAALGGTGLVANAIAARLYLGRHGPAGRALARHAAAGALIGAGTAAVGLAAMAGVPVLGPAIGLGVGALVVLVGLTTLAELPLDARHPVRTVTSVARALPRLPVLLARRLLDVPDAVRDVYMLVKLYTRFLRTEEARLPLTDGELADRDLLAVVGANPRYVVRDGHLIDTYRLWLDWNRLAELPEDLTGPQRRSARAAFAAGLTLGETARLLGMKRRVLRRWLHEDEGGSGGSTMHRWLARFAVVGAVALALLVGPLAGVAAAITVGSPVLLAVSASAVDGATLLVAAVAAVVVTGVAGWIWRALVHAGEQASAAVQARVAWLLSRAGRLVAGVFAGFGVAALADHWLVAGPIFWAGVVTAVGDLILLLMPNAILRDVGKAWTSANPPIRLFGAGVAFGAFWWLHAVVTTAGIVWALAIPGLAVAALAGGVAALVHWRHDIATALRNAVAKLIRQLNAAFFHAEQSVREGIRRTLSSPAARAVRGWFPANRLALLAGGVVGIGAVLVIGQAFTVMAAGALLVAVAALVNAIARNAGWQGGWSQRGPPLLTHFAVGVLLGAAVAALLLGTPAYATTPGSAAAPAGPTTSLVLLGIGAAIAMAALVRVVWRHAPSAVALLGIAVGAITGAHIAGIGRLSPVGNTVSGYVDAPAGAAFLAVGMVAMAAAVELVRLAVRTGIFTRVLLHLSSAALVLVAVFPTVPDAPAAFSSRMHLAAAAVLFVALPWAGIRLARALRAGRTLRTLAWAFVGTAAATILRSLLTTIDLFDLPGALSLGVIERIALAVGVITVGLAARPVPRAAARTLRRAARWTGRLVARVAAVIALAGILLVGPFAEYAISATSAGPPAASPAARSSTPGVSSSSRSPTAPTEARPP